MSRTLRVAAAICLLTIVLMMCGCSGGSPRRMDVGGLTLLDGTRANVGVVAESQITEVRFRLRNDSDQPIQFDDAVGTTCGCSAAEFDRTRLEPGEVGTLSVVVSTDDRQYGTRHIAALAHVLSPQDFPQRSIRFEVVVDVQASWQVVPSLVNVMVPPADVARFECRVLQGSTKHRLNLVQVSSTLPEAEFEVNDKPARPADAFNITVAFRAPDIPGVHHYTLSLETNDLSRPVRRVPVLVRVVPRWSLNPPVVTLIPDDNGRISGRTRLIGPWEDPQVSLDSEGDGLAVWIGPPEKIDTATAARWVIVDCLRSVDDLSTLPTVIQLVISDPTSTVQVPLTLRAK